MLRLLLLSLTITTYTYGENLIQKPYSFQKKFCSVAQQCNLNTANQCGSNIPIIKFKNKEQKCKTLQEYILDTTFNLLSTRTKIVSILMLQPYEVHFDFKEKLDLSIKKFNFLIQHLPLTIKLINIFQKKKYQLEYTDPPKNTSWKGSNNVNISGWASLFLGNFERQNLSYIASGHTKTIIGKLYGKAILKLNYQKYLTTKLQYNLKITIYMGSQFMKFLIDSWFAKKILKNQIQNILEDIAKCGKKINPKSIKTILSEYSWNLEEQKQLKVLYQLN